MKAIFSFFFLCLISITSLSAQITSEGCSIGYIRYYLDSDGDGYGTGSGRCHASQPPGTSIFAGDCDDSDPDIHPNTVWYADTDGDGLGNPSSTMTQCLQPTNYVLNSNDQCPTESGPAPTGCPESGGSGGTVTFSDMNYVHTVNFKKPFTSAPSSPTTDDVLQEITYLDGLGRPIQNIKINQALEGTAVEDLITEIAYDSYGRSTKDYLPYAEATSTPGVYQLLDLTEGRDFYYAKFANDFISQSATNAYSEKSLEASPLGRVLKQAAPGSSWKMGSGHEIEFDYQSNVSGSYTGKVRHFKVNLTAGTSSPTISSPGFYAAGELYKNVTRDENHSSGLNHTTEEFTNKKGQVVLKRTYNAGVAHDTYYVYDDYGNLTFVLPPKTDSTDALPTATELTELCYQYKYDGKNRLIEKKIPGKGWEFIVYNPLDQPILTKDANLSGKWLYTKYDAFGRVVSTGLHTHSASTQSAMQTVVNNHYSGSTPAWENHTSTSANYYYTNQSYPTSNNEVLTLNYYDDYNFDATSQGIKLSAGVSIFGTTVDYGVKGLPTGSKVKILDQASTNWITTVTHYDDHGQVIYTGSYNDLLQVKETIKNELEPITGNVLKTETYHKKGSNAAITVTDEFTYDDLNRMEKHTQSINGGTKELIAENSYDRLGQLKSKGVGNIATSSNRLQEVNYTYNVRGWLKQINNPTTLGTDLFAFKLNYNNTEMGISGVQPLYNGNISETLWRTANTQDTYSQRKRGYAFQYDHLNRITAGHFRRGNSTGSLFSEQVADYNVSGITYDLNGNIKSLIRTKLGGTMDNLTYDYHNSEVSNRLRRVTGTSGDVDGFKDGINTTNEYTYDGNGNMLKDLNKGIGTSTTNGISYNHLNLPKTVSIGGGTINYIYDATGVKQRKVAGTTTTDYAGNYMYKNNVLQFFSHPEGYVENISGFYKYHYQYKDHLGNIRLSYQEVNGNYKHIFDSDFTNSMDGWKQSGSVNYTLENGKLKAYVNSAWEGVNHPLTEVTTVAGETITVKLNFDKGNTVSNVRLYLPEYTSSGTLVRYNVLTSNLQNGYSEYTLTMLDSGNKIGFVRIDKDNTNTSTETYFYLDHVSVIQNGLVISQENNYYPFGLSHKGYNDAPNGHGNSAAKMFKFGAKELQDEEFGGKNLDWYDFGARNYDASLGRWMNLDPLAEAMEANSPYIYALNNPLYFFDPDGALPWPIHLRSFISAPSAGGGLFYGDGRGTSTESSPNATSRVSSTITVDPAGGPDNPIYSNLGVESDPTIFYGFGSPSSGLYLSPAVGRSDSSISVESAYKTESSFISEATVEFSHTGKDPLTPELFTPSLDVQASLTLTEDLEAGTLTIKGSITGDIFPSTEAFITDQSEKQNLLLGAWAEKGTLIDLVGVNKNSLFLVNMQIHIDKKGNFTGVTAGNSRYTVEEWNAHVQSEFNRN